MNALWEIFRLWHPFFIEIDEVKHQTTILWVVIFRYAYIHAIYIFYIMWQWFHVFSVHHPCFIFTFQILELSVHIFPCLEFQKTRSNISIIFNLRNFLFYIRWYEYKWYDGVEIDRILVAWWQVKNGGLSNIWKNESWIKWYFKLSSREVFLSIYHSNMVAQMSMRFMKFVA